MISTRLGASLTRNLISRRLREVLLHLGAVGENCVLNLTDVKALVKCCEPLATAGFVGETPEHLPDMQESMEADAEIKDEDNIWRDRVSARTQLTSTPEARSLSSV